jgi:hypothetical protein
MRKLGKQILWLVLGIIAVAEGWHLAGWGGVALVVGAILMWMLLHFTRMMRVLQRASSRPIGYCDSAVMLNAKLRPGVNLLHVVAMTRALGEQLSPKEEQPEVFRWTDGTTSSVTCEFKDGRLVKWELARPPQ